MTTLYVTTMKRPYPLDDQDPILLQSTLVAADVVPALSRAGCPVAFLEDVTESLNHPPQARGRRLREFLTNDGGLLSFYQIDLTKKEGSELHDNEHF